MSKMCRLPSCAWIRDWVGVRSDANTHQAAASYKHITHHARHGSGGCRCRCSSGSSRSSSSFETATTTTLSAMVNAATAATIALASDDTANCSNGRVHLQQQQSRQQRRQHSSSTATAVDSHGVDVCPLAVVATSFGYASDVPVSGHSSTTAASRVSSTVYRSSRSSVNGRVQQQANKRAAGVVR